MCDVALCSISSRKLSNFITITFKRESTAEHVEAMINVDEMVIVEHVEATVNVASVIEVYATPSMQNVYKCSNIQL